jgi:ABC-type Na+ efflux pump permease subunit
MNQVIVHKTENNSVAVTFPTGELSIEETQAKDTPEGSIIIDASNLPEADNDFFNAWELIDGKVLVNISKAKEITKNRLRIERKPLLQAQDVAFQRALESGANTSAIVAEKQRLRDLPTLADAATTLDELRSLTA